MTNDQLHLQAEKEWHSSLELRRQYPTFVFYWHEQYERVYNLPHKDKIMEKLRKTVH